MYNNHMHTYNMYCDSFLTSYISHEVSDVEMDRPGCNFGLYSVVETPNTFGCNLIRRLGLTQSEDEAEGWSNISIESKAIHYVIGLLLVEICNYVHLWSQVQFALSCC